MTIELLKSKIHKVTVTEADLNYVGSITIDETLMEAAHLIENEKVQVLNVNNGERFETYVIKGAKDSGVICLNGPAARKAYLAIVDRLDPYGNVPDVCCGTGKKNDYAYYRDRPHIHGDPHGQAPLMWMCRAFLEK